MLKIKTTKTTSLWGNKDLKLFNHSFVPSASIGVHLEITRTRSKLNFTRKLAVAIGKLEKRFSVGSTRRFCVWFTHGPQWWTGGGVQSLPGRDFSKADCVVSFNCRHSHGWRNCPQNLSFSFSEPFVSLLLGILNVTRTCFTADVFPLQCYKAEGQSELIGSVSRNLNFKLWLGGEVNLPFLPNTELFTLLQILQHTDASRLIRTDKTKLFSFFQWI